MPRAAAIMDGVKRHLKIASIIIALALLACLVRLVSRPNEPDVPVGSSVSATSRVPAFEVHVEKPRVNRPLFGLIPDGELLQFDHTSRGAQVGSVGHDRLELRAEGWDLLIEIDAEGRLAPGTRLVFPILLAEKQRTLRCRPADRASGYLEATTRAVSDVLDGRFLVELATCENAETGKVIEWPSAPLTVRGNFAGLPQGRR